MGRLSPDMAPPRPRQHHQGAHRGHPAGHGQRQRQRTRRLLGGLRVQVQAWGPEAAPLPHLTVPPPPGLAHVVRGLPGEALGGEAPQTQDEARESVLGRGPREPARAPSKLGLPAGFSECFPQSKQGRRGQQQHSQHPWSLRSDPSKPAGLCPLPRTTASRRLSHMPGTAGPADDKARPGPAPPRSLRTAGGQAPRRASRQE